MSGVKVSGSQLLTPWAWLLTVALLASPTPLQRKLPIVASLLLVVIFALQLWHRQRQVACRWFIGVIEVVGCISRSRRIICLDNACNSHTAQELLQ